MKPTDRITRFRGQYYFLSNFYPCFVELDGDLYPSVEHAFQAAKTTDKDVRAKFQVMDGPDTAKYYGRHLDEVKPGVTLRKDWEQVKDEVMYQLLKDKFTRTEPFESQGDLRRALVATGNKYIEEGNAHGDRYWGTVDGEGKNMLGKLLMKVREEVA